jgi:hypothetical protein
LTRAFWTVGVVTPWSLAISLRVSGSRSIMERLMFDSASGRTCECIDGCMDVYTDRWKVALLREPVNAV